MKTFFFIYIFLFFQPKLYKSLTYTPTQNRIYFFALPKHKFQAQHRHHPAPSSNLQRFQRPQQSNRTNHNTTRHSSAATAIQAPISHPNRRSPQNLTELYHLHRTSSCRRRQRQRRRRGVLRRPSCEQPAASRSTRPSPANRRRVRRRRALVSAGMQSSNR